MDVLIFLAGKRLIGSILKNVHNTTRATIFEAKVFLEKLLPRKDCPYLKFASVGGNPLWLPLRFLNYFMHVPNQRIADSDLTLPRWLFLITH